MSRDGYRAAGAIPDETRCLVVGGDNLDGQLDRAVESGRCLPEEAETVREFAAFLRESGPRGVPTPPEVMRKYQQFLNLSDVEVEDYARRYAERADRPPDHG